MSAENAGAAVLAHFDPAELLDGLATGIVLLDRHLCVIYANVAAQSRLAMSFKQARGRPVGELFAQPQEFVDMLQRALQRNEVCSGSDVQLQPLAPTHGLLAPTALDMTVTPLDSGLTGTHLLVELVDVTQRQRIARESEMQARMTSSRLMARQLAHEIKNPLGGMRGAAQLLERELASGELREYTALIVREVDRLSELADTMLGPSNAPRRLPLNLHEICEHVFRLLRGAAPPGVTLERDYDPSIPEGRFDRAELVQALLNIARNALQSVGAQGRLVLRTRALGNLQLGALRHRLVASVQVEDDGPGVPEHLQQSLFMPLVTGRSDGTGLGLTVAQAMVARQGGTIEFESRPGRTLFTLLIPVEVNE